MSQDERYNYVVTAVNHLSEPVDSSPVVDNPVLEIELPNVTCRGFFVFSGDGYPRFAQTSPGTPRYWQRRFASKLRILRRKYYRHRSCLF